MSDPNNGIYNTVLSYIPGTQQYTESSDHHVKNTSSASEEHHEAHHGATGRNSAVGGTGTGQTSGVGNTGSGNTSGAGNNSGVGNTGAGNTYGVGNTGSGNTGYASGNRTGDHDSQKALGGAGYETAGKTYGSEGHTFPSGERASGGGLGRGNTSGFMGQNQGSGGRQAQDTPSHLHSGQNTGTGSQAPGSNVNYGKNTYGSDGYNTSEPATGHKNPGSDVNYGRTTGGSDNYNNSQPASGYNNQAIGGSDGYNTSGPASGHKNQVSYEEDLADDTGTHHSGYKPDAISSQGTQTGHQEHGDGVRGAPIEGENVKGYAIGAPVGSGDTEKPNHPGDPSGQVSGAHMEYLPQETDTRDSTGRGTVGKSQGTGDSSFANVKTKDNNGNSSHVISQSSTSHMSHSSVTQL